MESFHHSPVLFVKSDGWPMEFYSNYTGEDKILIKAMVDYGGGIFHPKKVQSAVCLVDLGDGSIGDAGQVSISMKFVWDCVEQNTLLDTDSYLMTSQKPFRKEEDTTIIKFVLKHAEYPNMTLDQFYQSLSGKRILRRDAYSIKSRAKWIYDQIEAYNISESDIKKYKSVIKPALMYGSYCENDDYVILNFLKSRISRLHKKEVYDEMEKKQILRYPSESLIFRSLKLILPNIDLYDVAAEFKANVKEHLSQIHDFHGEPTLKDYVIIHYIQSNIKYMRNITLYIKMEEKKILNHPAEYMQLRFLYHILPNIDSYDIPPYFKKRFKGSEFDGFSIFYDESFLAPHRKYTKDEDYILIHYMEQRKAKPYSLAAYREIEKEQILKRGAKSLLHRFCNHIIPNINLYDISQSSKLYFKKYKTKHVQHKSKKQPNQSETVVSSESSTSSLSDFDVATPRKSDATWRPTKKVSDFVGASSENGIACEVVSDEEPVVTRSSTRAQSTGSRTSETNLRTSPSILRKRKKCLPLADSDTDSESSTVIRTTPSRGGTPNKGKKRGKGKAQKKNVQCEVTKPTYAGDIFSYFLSQKSLPDDSTDVTAFFSQNSLIHPSTSDGKDPAPMDSPCFLQAVLDRCHARTDELDSDAEEPHRNIEEHFPVETKMKFMSQAISSLQNIEENKLFQECVHDSLFYQKLVFRIYRINSTVYKNFLEKQIHNIVKKNKIDLAEKAILVKYLACLEKISPQNPLEVFSRFKLR